jgi:hypothetical protein
MLPLSYTAQVSPQFGLFTQRQARDGIVESSAKVSLLNARPALAQSESRSRIRGEVRGALRYLELVPLSPTIAVDATQLPRRVSSGIPGSDHRRNGPSTLPGMRPARLIERCLELDSGDAEEYAMLFFRQAAIHRKPTVLRVLRCIEPSLESRTGEVKDAQLWITPLISATDEITVTTLRAQSTSAPLQRFRLFS